jgi:uncharacterized damage-inducible protein DinB
MSVWRDHFSMLARYNVWATERLLAPPFAATLAHVFNHGTHHRGQITAALAATGHECPELDPVWMLQGEAAAAS